MLINQKDAERGLRAVHSRFYLSNTPIGLGIVGPGLIGSALIGQLKDQVRCLRGSCLLDAQPCCLFESLRLCLMDVSSV